MFNRVGLNFITSRPLLVIFFADFKIILQGTVVVVVVFFLFAEAVIISSENDKLNISHP